METLTVNLTLPTSWKQLTDRQLRFIFRLIAKGCTEAEVKAHCLLRWAGLRVVGHLSDGRTLLKQTRSGAGRTGGGLMFPVSIAQLANLLQTLAWLGELPHHPVRISRIGRFKKHKAAEASLHGLPFEAFLYCDNLYQGYLHTQDAELLRQMAEVLYDALGIKLSPAESVGVFYWFAAVKQLFAKTFTHFLQPVNEDGGNMMQASLATRLTEAMNAQLRALTKGDITKEETVRRLDTWRALYELDALAKDAEYLKNIK